MLGGGGMSGLRASEIGAVAQKAGQQVKKAVNPFIQSAQSQLTGRPAQPAGQSSSAKGFGLRPGDITADVKAQATGMVSGQQTDADRKTQQRQQQIVQGTYSPSAGVFDIAGLAKGFKQQALHQNGTGQAGGTQVSGQPRPQSSQPPNEFSSVQPKAFAFDDFNEADPFGATQKPGMPHQQAMQPSKKDITNQEAIAKQQAEDKQKYQALLNKLHQMQTEDVLKAGETEEKEKQKEEEQKKQQEEQEKEQREQEKEEKMQQQIAPQGKKQRGGGMGKKVKKAMGDMFGALGSIIKRKQGSHEGSGGKG